MWFKDALLYNCIWSNKTLRNFSLYNFACHLNIHTGEDHISIAGVTSILKVIVLLLFMWIHTQEKVNFTIVIVAYFLEYFLVFDIIWWYTRERNHFGAAIETKCHVKIHMREKPYWCGQCDRDNVLNYIYMNSLYIYVYIPYSFYIKILYNCIFVNFVNRFLCKTN